MGTIGNVCIGVIIGKLGKIFAIGKLTGNVLHDAVDPVTPFVPNPGILLSEQVGDFGLPIRRLGVLPSVPPPLCPPLPSSLLTPNS
jgi:hypothetical protein